MDTELICPFMNGAPCAGAKCACARFYERAFEIDGVETIQRAWSCGLSIPSSLERQTIDVETVE